MFRRPLILTLLFLSIKIHSEYTITHGGRDLLKIQKTQIPETHIPEFAFDSNKYFDPEKIKRIEDPVVIQANLNKPSSIDKLQKAFHLALNFQSPTAQITLIKKKEHAGVIDPEALVFYCAVCLATIHKDFQDNIPNLETLKEKNKNRFEYIKNQFYNQMVEFSKFARYCAENIQPNLKITDPITDYLSQISSDLKYYIMLSHNPSYDNFETKLSLLQFRFINELQEVQNKGIVFISTEQEEQHEKEILKGQRTELKELQKELQGKTSWNQIKSWAYKGLVAVAGIGASAYLFRYISKWYQNRPK
jgi:hypothetical protein